MSGSNAGAIRAAGGVVWRHPADSADPAGPHPVPGTVEVALVHRPRYDDWSLPKGKAHDGESELAAAVREVGEEVGVRVAVSRRLTRIRYRVDGRRKTVAYWAMQALDGEFIASEEVDELRWLPVPAAGALASYPQDRQVLAQFAAVPVPDSVVLVVRHAKAGKRTKWKGPDLERPLDAEGRRQAERLRTFLPRFAPEAVVSARPRRCAATVEPVAAVLGLDVVVDACFDDDAYAADPAATREALVALARSHRVALVSSQGETIPGVIGDLVPTLPSTKTRKGAVWVLTFVAGEVASADYYGEAAR